MNEDFEKDVELVPDPSRIVEGLRDTGYDFNTALADIVDNSISAGATKIDVRINLNPNNEVNVYIADNGCGMNFDDLKNAMTYGSKERIDPKSLGKFGLGLKTASTAFCRSLSVLSKTNTSEYNRVTWDLDYVAKVNAWKLLHDPVKQEEIDFLEMTTDGGSGTLVMWDKVDRLLKSYSNTVSFKKAFQRIISSLSNHFAMTYQRFLDSEYTDNPITLTLNGDVIAPWDPLCLKEEKTEILHDKDHKVKFEEEGEELSFHLKAAILPRVEDWSSSEAHSKARINNDNEGFYVYRENRLIYHGDWLGMFTNDPHYALLRIEFSFNHELDELFNVDIKKSQIKLNEDIYDYLKTKFLPAPRQRASELYRATAAKKQEKSGEDKHKKANKTIEEKGKEVEKSRVEIIDKDNGTVKIHNSNGSSTGKLIILDLDEKSNHRVIAKALEEDTFLWKGTIANQEHAVIINTSHPFYSKIYEKVQNSDVVAGIDYLLWSLAESELSTVDDKCKEQYEDMRFQTSKILKKLLEEIPENDDEVL